MRAIEKLTRRKGTTRKLKEIEAVKKSRWSPLMEIPDPHLGSPADHGEIETEHPGYLGSQDTFFVGTLKGVGRIYQQSFVDT